MGAGGEGETKCIFLTAHPEFEYALAAIRLGDSITLCSLLLLRRSKRPYGWPASLSGGNGKINKFLYPWQSTLGKKRGCWQQEPSVRGFSRASKKFR